MADEARVIRFRYDPQNNVVICLLQTCGICTLRREPLLVLMARALFPSVVIFLETVSNGRAGYRLILERWPGFTAVNLRSSNDGIHCETRVS